MTSTAAAQCPSITALEAVIADYCARHDPTEAQKRHLNWVKRLLAQSIPLGLTPEAGESLEDLLSPDAMRAFWQLARSGQASGRPRPLADPSMRAIGHALDVIAGHARIPGFWRPASPGRAPLRAVVRRPTRHELRDRLAREVDAGSRDATRARLLAMSGVILDTGARNKELAAMVVTGGALAWDLSMLRVDRYPQGYIGDGPAETVTLRLSEVTRTALARWLDFREDLVANLEGTCEHLWVSVIPHHTGRPGRDGETGLHPAGWPLQPRGIARALAYMELPATAGEDGDREPTNLEQLCRAIRDEDARAFRAEPPQQQRHGRRRKRGVPAAELHGQVAGF